MKTIYYRFSYCCKMIIGINWENTSYCPIKVNTESHVLRHMTINTLLVETFYAMPVYLLVLYETPRSCIKY